MPIRPRGALSALALLLLASCAAAARRRLLQAQNAAGCGALDAPCCELATGGGVRACLRCEVAAAAAAAAGGCGSRLQLPPLLPAGHSLSYVLAARSRR